MSVRYNILLTIRSETELQQTNRTLRTTLQPYFLPWRMGKTALQSNGEMVKVFRTHREERIPIQRKKHFVRTLQPDSQELVTTGPLQSLMKS